ncbi:MAG: response regulator [Acidobacteria bacterium]|nr:MAG: response regulator [Acidobacteriota bacterium]
MRVGPVENGEGARVTAAEGGGSMSSKGVAESPRIERLFELSMDLLCVADSCGRMQLLSPAVKEILGYDAGELVGTSLIDLVHADDRPKTQKAVAELAAGQAIVDFESRCRTCDGSYRWLAWRARSAGDEIYAVGRDITARKRAEAEQQSALQRQHAQKLESLGRLAGGIAHDFNNLLVGILGNAGLALMKLPADDPSRRFILGIETAAQRATELTNQMLAYAGRGQFFVEPVALREVIEDMQPSLNALAGNRAALRLQLAEGLPAIEADPAQVQQVVSNLIANAADAIGNRPGTITLRTGVRQVAAGDLVDAVLAEDLPAGLYVYLEVSDDGCGMDAAILGKIFDPFFTTKVTGRGLGMAAVLGIVRGHGGFIETESEAGGGTTIRVSFPAYDQEALDWPPLPAGEGADFEGSGTVLVVDDESTVRDVARACLEEHGFTVLTAADGHQAVEIYRRKGGEIALVLLDMTMPELDGEGTFAALREIRPEVKVILSSGYDEKQATGRFAEVRPQGFVQKPYRPADLLLAVRRALEA